MNARSSLFIRWWVHQLRTFDCDPAIVAMKYICNRMELNVEQRHWFCFLYANTYQLPTAWVLFNEFPDYENVPQHRIESFSKENAGRLPYQKDQKWLRGNLGKTFRSYRANLGGIPQAAWFTGQLCDTGRDSFSRIWETILKDFHLFGRYTAWFYLQALKEVCGLPIQATSLMLGFEASKTHREGLCRALDLDDWCVKDCKFTDQMFATLNAGGQLLLDKVQAVPELKELPVQPDYFSMETALCSFKKLFRRQQGRYLGFYHDRFGDDIIKTSSMNWPGINWTLFWHFRQECLIPEMRNTGTEKWKMNLFLDLGVFHESEALMERLDEWLSERLISQSDRDLLDWPNAHGRRLDENMEAY